ncbi:3-hydroxyacyl-CoA dehydrogenase family protein [Deinococcus pimensis]|uniref:3-hydroxyacyl-CoA dehydrogenase family protein n=1 Tax=Deinococcus pimensis TaxID=309888 RepID=UPI000481CA7A|nr:3-hydroxybutyryl-CoA dehydrogenase [Deinococcus pimensis]
MRFGVIGAGQMGAGIAQVAAQAEFDVVLHDVEQRFVERGRATISGSLAKLHEKGRLTGTPEEVMGRVRFTTDLADFADRDLVVEAIVENEGVKSDLFRRLGEIVQPGGVLASNTSSIPITSLGAASGRPEKFIGMHFMNPVPLMQLVEVIRGYSTSDETARTVLEAARRMGKTPLECNDFPGFVSNRVLMPMINEAIQCVMEGVATPEAIDGIMKMGMNHPMGPLTLADFIGLDTCLAIMEVLHRGLGDDKYRPSPLLRKMVQAGLLGRKSGRGFYEYQSK